MYLFIPPKQPGLSPNITQRQHHRRLCPLIDSLLPRPFCHVCHHISRTTSVNQRFRTLLFLRERYHLGHARTTSLRNRIRSAGPAFRLLVAGAHGGFEAFHQGRDLPDGGGGEKLLAEGWGIFVKTADPGGYIYKAAAVFDKREEVLGGFQSAIVVALEGFFDDVAI